MNTFNVVVRDFGARTLAWRAASRWLAQTVSLALAWLLVAAVARAQCPATWVAGIGSPGADNVVYALLVLPSGDVIVGGNFGSAGTTNVNNIARYNPTTGTWTALGAGTNGAVNALTLLSTGEVIVGGNFTTAGPISANRIAKYNPSTNTWSALGLGVNGAVYAQTTLAGGDLLVGGSFSSAGSGSASNVARYNISTGAWSAAGAGTNGTVLSLCVLPVGDVIVGGDFTTAGGSSVGRIARYSPTGNAWSALPSASANLPVRAMVALPSGEVIVGGAFTTFGVSASRVVRYNPSTGTKIVMGAGVSSTAGGDVYSLALIGGGDVLVGGDFTFAGGAVANNIARLNPSTGAWSVIGVGTDASVNAFALTSNGNVLMGGLFTSAGGTSAGSLARLSFDPTIVSQPLPVVSAPTGAAMFSVAAISGTGAGSFNYAWRKGGVAINTTINPSAATRVLSLSNLQASDLASYDCLITNACGGTGTLSSAAALTFVNVPACRVADVASVGGARVPDGQKTADDLIIFLDSFFSTCP